MFLFNGMRYTYIQTFGSTLVLLLCYDKFKYFFLPKFENPTTAISISSFFASLMSTTSTFPFEYWKTLVKLKNITLNAHGNFYK